MGRVLLNSNSQHLISPVCRRLCWIAQTHGGPLNQTLCGKNPEIQSWADCIYKPTKQYVCPQHLFFCTWQTRSVEKKKLINNVCRAHWGSQRWPALGIRQWFQEKFVIFYSMSAFCFNFCANWMGFQINYKISLRLWLKMFFKVKLLIWHYIAYFESILVCYSAFRNINEIVLFLNTLKWPFV